MWGKLESSRDICLISPNGKEKLNYKLKLDRPISWPIFDLTVSRVISVRHKRTTIPWISRDISLCPSEYFLIQASTTYIKEVKIFYFLVNISYSLEWHTSTAFNVGYKIKYCVSVLDCRRCFLTFENVQLFDVNHITVYLYYYLSLFE
jgi:hypothetical protein